MRLAATLTVDGLIRSLRGLAHGLAEQADRDYPRRGRSKQSRPAPVALGPGKRIPGEEISHDRSRV